MVKKVPNYIERYFKRVQFSYWALYLPSITSHSLWMEFGCF